MLAKGADDWMIGWSDGQVRAKEMSRAGDWKEGNRPPLYSFTRNSVLCLYPIEPRPGRAEKAGGGCLD
jgi:hypothetical protein